MPGPAKQFRAGFNIRIDRAQREAFAKLAESRGTTPSELIRAYIDQELEAARRKMVKRAS